MAPLVLPGGPAGAGGLHRGLAGVAGPPVAPRQALVVLTAQGFTAHLAKIGSEKFTVIYG